MFLTRVIQAGGIRDTPQCYSSRDIQGHASSRWGFGGIILPLSFVFSFFFRGEFYLPTSTHYGRWSAVQAPLYTMNNLTDFPLLTTRHSKDSLSDRSSTPTASLSSPDNTPRTMSDVVAPLYYLLWLYSNQALRMLLYSVHHQSHRATYNPQAVTSTANTPSGALQPLIFIVSMCSVFKADRELHSFLGPFAKFDHSADKSITITIVSPDQGVKLLSLRSLVGEPVYVELHPSCRQSQGIVTCPILNHLTELDILEGLAPQSFNKVIWLSAESGTYKLTFGTPTPPKMVTLCHGHIVPVRPAYPLPTCCFRCQHYDHSHTTCKSTRVICGRCGQEQTDSHDSKSCNRDAHCFHCNTPHAATSPLCPKYCNEKDNSSIASPWQYPSPRCLPPGYYGQ